MLGIYPEGTRSPDGRLYKGRTGVARLALESRAPVVPCAMINTFEFLPPGSFHPQLRLRPGVIFGQPMDFSRYYGKESDRAVLRAVTDEIMRRDREAVRTGIRRHVRQAGEGTLRRPAGGARTYRHVSGSYLLLFQPSITSGPRTARLGLMRVGVLTGGGDCPGLNAVIRAVVRRGIQEFGLEFVGFRDGWRGPLEADTVPLDVHAVRGILPRGGTILGSSRTNPFKETGPGRNGVERIKDNMAGLGVDALIVDRRRGHAGRRRPACTRRASTSSACRRPSTTTSAPPITPSASTPR